VATYCKLLHVVGIAPTLLMELEDQTEVGAQRRLADPDPERRLAPSHTVQLLEELGFG
jgi:hypothetical protein